MVFRISHLTPDELTAIHAYAHGWNDDGDPYFKCSTCTEGQKKSFGCGYDDALRGTGKLKPGKHDIHGTCPGWWRQQDFVADLITMRQYRQNLGHPLHIPHRLVQGLQYLDIYEAEAERARLDRVKEKR